MPFAAVERPSIGLGLLSSTLTQAGVASRVRYPNLQFAEQVGLPRYRLVEVTRNDDLLGEWVFAKAAFREQTPADEAFLECVDLTAAARLGSRAEVLRAFAQMRRQAVDFVEATARSLVSEKPAIVGASSMFQQHCASLALLRRVKELDPGILTMLGGANCDGVMGQASYAAFPWLDCVVCGEADEEIVAIVQQLLQERTRRCVVCSRPVTDLDALPTPDFTAYFAALHKARFQADVRPGLLVETSRGCWWGQKHHCTFCGLNAGGMAFRAKSAERILTELADLSETYHLKQFELTDNILAMERFRDLLPRLQDRSYTMFAEVKANLRREHMQALAEAGVRWIQPGLENLHDEVLRLMDKGTNAAVNLQLLKWAREFGIFVSWNFLVGFPGEQDAWYQEMSSWLPSLVHLQPPQGVFRARFDRYSPYQRDPGRYGLKMQFHPAYRAIYPVPEGVLADLAYFHLEARQQWSPALWDSSAMGPGLAALDHHARAWGQAFWADLPAILSMQDDGQSLSILDTRPCAQARRHNLTGAHRELYLACDSARGLKALGNGFQAILEELCGQKLMLKLGDGRYLSLAVAGELPRLLRPREFPGGACQVQAGLA